MPELNLGDIVRVTHLSPGVVILASEEHLGARQEGVQGRVVALHSQGYADGVQLVWVRHLGVVAPYYDYELALVGTPVEG